MSFAHLMAGQVGRSVRVVAGLALIIAGLVLGSAGGYVLESGAELVVQRGAHIEHVVGEVPVSDRCNCRSDRKAPSASRASPIVARPPRRSLPNTLVLRQLASISMRRCRQEDDTRC